MLRVTFIHPKACFPLPLVSDLYALGKGGLNPSLKLYTSMCFSRGPSPVLMRPELLPVIGWTEVAFEFLQDVANRLLRASAGTPSGLGIRWFMPEPRSQAGAETSLVFGGVFAGL